ncbi:TPA: hypothetical protein EYP44_00600 [Candidatus Bathyarchaeota archaeon]|nr:hypothetical protein [Candidatus Bathyarchaeota archaeon]
MGRPEAYEIWPNFEPVYKKEEYVWTVLSKLGEVLLLNCGQCEGPSDIRHSICRKCVMDRTKIAAEDYYETTGKLKDKWPIVILCRVFKW